MIERNKPQKIAVVLFLVGTIKKVFYLGKFPSYDNLG